MTPEFKALWIEALRSGKYKQGRGALRRGDTFCCLGVACDLIDPDAWEGGEAMDWDGYRSNGLFVPFMATSDSCELARLNDKGYSFDEIADFIEHNPLVGLGFWAWVIYTIVLSFIWDSET